jgi:hypothetical protein
MMIKVMKMVMNDKDIYNITFVKAKQKKKKNGVYLHVDVLFCASFKRIDIRWQRRSRGIYI